MKNKGIAYTIAAYTMWGFIPVYFKFLKEVPPLQIISHRLVWSFVFLTVLLLLRRELPALVASIRPRVVLIYLCAGIFLALNWLTFVWAVNNGHVVESSLGYFINPLLSVVLGLVFLGERLRSFQWIPVGLAAVGVVYLTVIYGAVPWISLALAFTFGLYGLVKKIAPLGSLHGLELETALILLPAVVYLIFVNGSGEGAFIHSGLSTTLLLIGAGVVTAIPLLMFAIGASTTPLSTMGLLQYITPTLQFAVGVFLYHEPFTADRAVGFAVIWLALLIFSADGIVQMRRAYTSETPC
jgi:chloramphenicol-sensitive protein RarD